MNDIPYVRHTPAQMQQWERHFEENAHARETRDLIVSYTRERGGVTLELFRLLLGPYFGEPTMMRPSLIADELGVPVSDLAQAHAETWAWVRANRGSSGE